MTVPVVPSGYHSISPYLTVTSVSEFVEFAIAVFGAKMTEQLIGKEGRVGHTEIRIGDSVIMMSEANVHHPAAPMSLYIYVEDAQTTFGRALAHGAAALTEPEDQYYGDHMGGVIDPFGNTWWIASHIEDLSPEEIARRAAERP